MRGETRRKARSRYPGDEALRRVSPRRRRERRGRERERGRAPEHRAELPRVPSAATVGVVAERNLTGRGGFDRTAARRRICIRQAAAWTEKPPAQKGEHGCPKQSRTLSGKPARHKIGLKSNRVRRLGSSRVKGSGGFAAGKRAPRRGAPTKMAHIPLPKAARRGGYAGCRFAAHYKPTAARTFSICAAAAARAFFAPSRKMSSSASESFSSSSRLALNGSNIRWYAARSAFLAWP